MELIRVAVDGSRVSGHALTWAVGLADRLGAVLEVVTVVGLHGPVFADADEEPEGKLEWWVTDRQKEFLAEVVGDPGDVDVRYRGLEGHPVEALLGDETVPDLLVVGTRGVGGFVGLLVGSTAHQLIDHAPCPVAVVPDTEEPPALPAAAVVGVDGSDVADAALGWAATTLAPTGTRLLAVHARGGALVTRQGEEGMHSDAELERQTRERVPASEVVDQWIVFDERPSTVLVERAAAAGLLVLGLPRPEGPGGLGSVAHRCLRGTTVPVIVVRPRTD